MKEIIKPIPILACIVVLLLLISIGKTNKIKSLKKDLLSIESKNTDNIFDETYTIYLENKVNTLELEIMGIGNELDSMKLKYD